MGERGEADVTVEELLDFCAKREVEIYASYNFNSDSIIYRMRKKNLQLETSISRDAAHYSGFGLTVRIVLRDMADKLDKKLNEETTNDN